MCNCSNKREVFATGNSSSLAKASSIFTAAYFEYTGHSGLTVTGAFTGKRYRFKHTGSVELIEAGDVAGMMSVPVLKLIKNDFSIP